MSWRALSLVLVLASCPGRKPPIAVDGAPASVGEAVWTASTVLGRNVPNRTSDAPASADDSPPPVPASLGEVPITLLGEQDFATDSPQAIVALVPTSPPLLAVTLPAAWRDTNVESVSVEPDRTLVVLQQSESPGSGVGVVRWYVLPPGRYPPPAIGVCYPM